MGIEEIQENEMYDYETYGDEIFKEIFGDNMCGYNLFRDKI